jgi:hypothetical protein
MRTSRLIEVLSGRRSVVLPALCLLVLMALPAPALAGDTTKVFVMDRCESDSFDAAIEPGTCVRNGGVTFENFARRLNPKDGGHNAWRFSRHDVVLEGDEHLALINSGGEVHTFTEVAGFGAGFVPPLNAALPPGTPDAQPVGNLNLMGAGEKLQLGTLSPGRHLFECLIHPWMRTTAEQR